MARYVLKLLNDRTMLQTFGAAGRRIIEKRFTLERQMERYQALYESLLK